ncbi:hypothetical protein [Faucicola boevrei]|uniref:hypothetical protein n=1 Tax=Faucicola boevrei TaxID=346665 RepID=UPI000374CF56|nr:hypothetical protein [Moraxella boevrei]
MSQQPQGVIAIFDTTQIPAEGFIALEKKEQGQTVLPSHIVLQNQANNAKLALNDGLLRTCQDSISLYFAGGNASLYILKNPVKQASELTKDNVIIAYQLTQAGIYILKKLNNHYQFTLQTNIAVMEL